MKKKVYATPDLKDSYLCEPNIIFASVENDTLINDENIWDYVSAWNDGGIES